MKRNVTDAAKVTRLRTSPRGVRGIGDSIEEVASITLCALSLFAFKLVSMFGAFVEKVMCLLQINGLLRLRPGFISFLGLGVALCAALPPTAALLLALGDWPLREGALLGGLALIVSCAPHALVEAARMRTLDEIADPVESWFVPRMVHPADAVWPRVVGIMSLLVLPAAVALVIPGAFGVRVLAIYGAVVWVTWKPATDFEHADAHYHFFRARRDQCGFDRRVFMLLDVYLTYLFPLALARVPYWYEVQHVVIHHAEDNSERDTQSTLRYDRSSFIDFAKCSSRFAISSLLSIDVFAYLVGRRSRRAISKLVGGMLLFYGCVVVLFVIDWRIALAVLVCRYIGGIVSSLGFFQEHGIIDVAEPDNIFRNSLHYIAPDNTHGSRGEDFHIAHHLSPGRHWAEYESLVVADRPRYAREHAVGFLDGPGHIDAYYRLLWRRDFTGLARYFVLFGRPDIPTEEMASLLRDRTRPLGAQGPQAPRRIDLILGGIASHLLG